MSDSLKQQLNQCYEARKFEQEQSEKQHIRLQAEFDALKAKTDKLQAAYNNLRSENDRIQSEIFQLRSELKERQP